MRWVGQRAHLRMRTTQDKRNWLRNMSNYERTVYISAQPIIRGYLCIRGSERMMMKRKEPALWSQSI